MNALLSAHMTTRNTWVKLCLAWHNNCGVLQIDRQTDKHRIKEGSRSPRELHTIGRTSFVVIFWRQA